MLRAIDHFSHSDTGRARRANEDSYYARSPVFVVADGMGGAQAGEVASRVAVETFERGLGDDGGSGSGEELLAARVQEANARIHEMSQAQEERAGMGTTITAAHVGEHDVAIAHVGDSRAYRLRGSEFVRLTEDHSLVEEMRRRGQLTAQEAGGRDNITVILFRLEEVGGASDAAREQPTSAGGLGALTTADVQAATGAAPPGSLRGDGAATATAPARSATSR